MPPRRPDPDPRIFWLRTATVVLFLALLAWLVVFEDGPNDVAAIGTLSGSLIVVLGFAAVVSGGNR